MPHHQQPIEFTIPLRTVSALNMREHWAAKAKRVKWERNETAAALRGLSCPRVDVIKSLPWPRLVTLTRVGPRRMDFDNAISGLKGCRDELAKWLGVDDGDESRVEWAYRMARGPYAVRVSIESATPACVTVTAAQLEAVRLAALGPEPMSAAEIAEEHSRRNALCGKCGGFLMVNGTCPACSMVERLRANPAIDTVIRRRS